MLSVLGFAVSPTIGLLLGSMLAVGLLFNRDNRRLIYTTAFSLACGLMVFIPGAIMHMQTARRIGCRRRSPWYSWHIRRR